MESIHSINSAFAREIIFRLTSPEGTLVSLVEADTYFPSGSGPTPGSRITVTFDDAAANLVGSTGFVGGTFFPVGSLSAFNNEGAVGTWTLSIEDDTGGDPLGFANVKLDIQLPERGSNASEPATIMLLAFGLVALEARRRPATWVRRKVARSLS